MGQILIFFQTDHNLSIGERRPNLGRTRTQKWDEMVASEVPCSHFGFCVSRVWHSPRKLQNRMSLADSIMNSPRVWLSTKLQNFVHRWLDLESVVTLWPWSVKSSVVTERALSGLIGLSKTQMCVSSCQFYPTLLRFNRIGFRFRSRTRMSQWGILTFSISQSI